MLPHEWNASTPGFADTWKNDSHLGTASTFHVFNERNPKTAIVIEITTNRQTNFDDCLEYQAKIAQIVANFAKCIKVGKHGAVDINRAKVDELLHHPWANLE